MILYLRTRVSILIFLLFATLSTSSHANSQQIYYEKLSSKPLTDILEDIEFAITEHNLRIVDHLHIGKAIKKRGREDFPEYEVILYCSISFAEKMLDLVPEYINLCPGRITVREEKTSYVISASLWPEKNSNVELNRLMFNMNKIIKEIVDYAALVWLNNNEK